MATEQPKSATEDVKIDLFVDDDQCWEPKANGRTNSKDVATLRKEVQRIELSIEQSSEHLRIEFKTSLEATAAEMRQLFSQVMSKLGSSSSSQLPETPINVSTSRTNDSNLPCNIDPKPFTKHAKLQCPRFNGDDFLGWRLKIE
ncbi:putative 26S proteasome complex subunit sem1-1-like protein [Corchorus capsularis]|uniref:Putative 26S proteasome complex subunit sem1-1-like protein n=1 Tax=Corchorus capsularis TaxID=210143 RepID=A0A1R3I386_COCAP|nr:putative 26S proteasome complex subunit sem1-1-like protein [Corchorus capsularis]